jgi:hypothetical protein
MPTNTLLVAQLDFKQVAIVERDGTSAFLPGPVQHVLEYSLTLSRSGSRRHESIALYNFGRGKREAVKMPVARTQPH